MWPRDFFLPQKSAWYFTISEMLLFLQTSYIFGECVEFDTSWAEHLSLINHLTPTMYHYHHDGVVVKWLFGPLVHCICGSVGRGYLCTRPFSEYSWSQAQIFFHILYEIQLVRISHSNAGNKAIALTLVEKYQNAIYHYPIHRHCHCQLFVIQMWKKVS